jgi:uncharacterized RDD family membrane protein YckC
MEADDLAKAYSPPGSDVNAGLSQVPSDVVLADRAVRLLAVMLDGLLASLPFLPFVAVGVYVLAVWSQRFPKFDPTVDAMPPMADPQLLALLGGSMVIGLLGFLGLVIYQWVLISRTGQSLGKKWTGIRIERTDGRPVDFTSGVLIRNWVLKLVGMVPYAGLLFQLVDVLLIFAQDRRCIHDHLAGTRVVRVQR